MKTFIVVALIGLGAPLGLIAQSTSGSSGKGTTEPGPSAAEASSFGNTGRTPSVTGSNDKAPRTGTATTDAQAPATTATGSFHGSAITADALFRALDTNGDGQLTREEFAKFHAVMGTMRAGGAAASGQTSGSSK